MNSLAILIGFIIHSTITATIGYGIVKYLNNKYNIKPNKGVIIFLILMVSHWYLFNGCILTFIIDKPITKIFNSNHLDHHKFSDTPIYKLFIKK